MEQFQRNDVTFCLNEVEQQDTIYVSVTLGAGFSPKELQIDDDHIMIGSAAMKVFSNYVKQRMREKHNTEMSAIVSMSATSFTWETTKEKHVADIQHLLEELYEKNINEDALLREKQRTIDGYKKVYKDLAFRGQMKLQEFTHTNKSFQLDELSQDLLDVDASTIQKTREYLVLPSNTFVFCHGKADKSQLNQLIIPSVPTREINYLYHVSNYHFLQNQEYAKQSKGNYWCGSTRFERNPVLTDLEKEYVVLQLIGELSNRGPYRVEVDPFDASIVYERKGQKKIDSFTSLLTEERVQVAKKEIYQRLSKELTHEPEQFTEKVGRLFVNHIHYFECISYLEEVTAKDIHQFITMRDYRLREGFVRYYKEGNKNAS